MSQPPSAANQWQYPTAAPPGQMPAAPARAALPGGPGAAPGPGWQGHAGSNRLVLGILGAVAGCVGVLVVVGIVLDATGAGNVTIGAIAALVPLAIVVAGVLWLDRWEPEPRWLLGLGLLWGAGVATAVSLTINTHAFAFLYEATGDQGLAEMGSAAVIAPIVEETTKGLGVLLIYLIWRNHFDGPVDGVVYAAVVAGGFAFVENILYFARGNSEGMLMATFIARAILSPFAHVLFTTVTGLAIGFASRARQKRVLVFAFPIGLVLAMGLHAFWNASASIGAVYIGAYIVIQVPLFIAMIGLMFWLRRQESELVSDRLGEYGRAGWFAPHEVSMLSSLRARSQARSWAAGHGPQARSAMVAFQKDATQLAYARDRVRSGRPPSRGARTEAELLDSLTQARIRFTQAAQGALA